MIYHVTIGSHTLVVDVGADGVTVDGKPTAVDLAQVPGTSVRNLIIDHHSYRVVGGRTGSGLWSLHLRGRRFDAEVLDERTRAIREMTGAGAGPTGPRPIKAPMPGLVVKVEVEVGDVVVAGQGIVIVEAMKMENELKAEGAARVKAIHVAAGDTVDKEQVLVDWESLDEDGG